MVRVVGLEPTWIYPLDFKSSAYTNSATLAFICFAIVQQHTSQNIVGSRSLIRTDDRLITSEILYQLSYTGRLSD